MNPGNFSSDSATYFSRMGLTGCGMRGLIMFLLPADQMKILALLFQSNILQRYPKADATVSGTVYLFLVHPAADDVQRRGHRLALLDRSNRPVSGLKNRHLQE